MFNGQWAAGILHWGLTSLGGLGLGPVLRSDLPAQEEEKEGFCAHHKRGCVMKYITLGRKADLIRQHHALCRKTGAKQTAPPTLLALACEVLNRKTGAKQTAPPSLLALACEVP